MANFQLSRDAGRGHISHRDQIIYQVISTGNYIIIVFFWWRGAGRQMLIDFADCLLVYSTFDKYSIYTICYYVETLKKPITSCILILNRFIIVSRCTHDNSMNPPTFECSIRFYNLRNRLVIIYLLFHCCVRTITSYYYPRYVRLFWFWIS